MFLLLMRAETRRLFYKRDTFDTKCCWRVHDVSAKVSRLCLEGVPNFMSTCSFLQAVLHAWGSPECSAVGLSEQTGQKRGSLKRCKQYYSTKWELLRWDWSLWITSDTQTYIPTHRRLSGRTATQKLLNKQVKCNIPGLRWSHPIWTFCQSDCRASSTVPCQVSAHK